MCRKCESNKQAFEYLNKIAKNYMTMKEIESKHLTELAQAVHDQRLWEQFKNINDAQPVFAGDLISKEDKRKLCDLKLIMHYEDEDLEMPGYAKGTGGYVMTELGKRVHSRFYEMFLLN